MASQAMAQLGELAGDHGDARRWAQRGLAIDPYAATLALLLSRLAKELVDEPLVVETLEHAINAHPMYPDLRIAIIRHEVQAGRAESARQHLDQWQADQPDHPLAVKMNRELAA
jgi:hypothetical protein